MRATYILGFAFHYLRFTFHDQVENCTYDAIAPDAQLSDATAPDAELQSGIRWPEAGWADWGLEDCAQGGQLGLKHTKGE